MDKKELVNVDQPQVELLPVDPYDLSTPQTGEKTYRLANIWKVMFARLFDLLVSAIPGMIVNAVVLGGDENVGNWGLMSGVLIATLAWSIVYFVVIPYFTKGITFGKWVFGLRMKRKGENKKIGFWILMLREAVFNFFPWLVVVLAQVIGAILMSKYANDDTSTGNSPALLAASLLVNLSNIFYVLWLALLGVGILVQEHHQATVDFKFNIFVVGKIAIEDEIKTAGRGEKTLSRDDKHVALKAQPGNFSKDQIDDLYVSEEEQLKSSIYLEKDNLVEDMKIENKRKEAIESKKKNKGDKHE